MKFLARTACWILWFLATPAFAFEWQDLWLNNNQQALKKLDSQPDQAAEQFDDPAWRGVGQYRAGNYEEAVREFSENTNPVSIYNQGNAMARAGKLEEALKHYEGLLEQGELDASLRDNTQFNRDLVKQLLDQQQGAQQTGESQNSEQDEENTQSEEQSGQQNQQSQSGQDQQSSGDSSENSMSEPQDTDSGEQSAEMDNAGEQKESEDSSQTGEDAAQSDEDKNTSQDSTENSAAEIQDQEPLSEDEQATEQWLRNIPEDPTGLLRRKLNQTHRNQYPQIGNGGQPW